MEEDGLLPQNGPAKLRNLDDLSIEDLKEYIVELEAEIGRVKEDIANKNRHREGVEGLFKRE